MGYYITDHEPAVEKSRRKRPPSKNRVWKNFSTSRPRTGFFASQLVEPHWEKQPTPTTTASGVLYYGYRFYSPDLGRWLSRDPIGEEGFRRVLVSKRLPKRVFDYLSFRNSPINKIDLLGLHCRVVVAMGHASWVREQINRSPVPDRCDRFGPVSCFIDEVLDEIPDEWPDEVSISDWPKRPGLLSGEEVLDFLKEVNEILLISIEDLFKSPCCCEEVLFSVKCDKDMVRLMDALVGRGDLRSSACNTTVTKKPKSE